MLTKHALVAVFEKNGVEKVVKRLIELGFIVHTTKGTFSYLKDKGFGEAVKPLSDITGFEEWLGGRVKTLDQKVFSCILANTEEDFRFLENQKLPFFRLVLVELYPFKEKQLAGLSEKELVELIDIGGVSLIRAAAKNYRHVSVVFDRNLLERGIASLEDAEERKRLMAEAFLHTAKYDSGIMEHFQNEKKALFIEKKNIELRYGENPHQKASCWKFEGARSVFDYMIYSKKEMSFNNYMDFDALIRLLKELKGLGLNNVCAIIKHNNPCGVATGNTLTEAYEKALSCDQTSAFGGVFGFTELLDLDTAKKLGERFIDIIAAPGFEAKAFEKVSEKKNRRIINISGFDKEDENLEYRYVRNGFLVQKPDTVDEKFKKFRLVCGKELDKEKEIDAMLALVVAKCTKSNAIIITNNNQTVGIGAGQMSRVDSARIALLKAKDAKLKVREGVAASDAFLPFPDSMEMLAEAGVKVLLQPGGSINDEKIIKRAEELGVSMYFTGIRHFRH